MGTRIRPAQPDDVEDCGRIIHLAFSAIAERHGFPSDFPTKDDGVALARQRIGNPVFYAIVSETDGRVSGSCFMTERDPIRGIGTVSVDPGVQDGGNGRMLMEATVERGRDAAGMRLTQDAFNSASMSLYASVGFDIVEPLALIAGTLRGRPEPGIEVRQLTAAEVPACEALCVQVHGFPRSSEVMAAVDAQTGHVAIRGGRVAAYTTAAIKRGHGVAESDDDMRALLLGVSAQAPSGISLLLPTRQADLFRWCLREGLRVVKPLTLMARGAYQVPRGSFYPSTQY